MPSPQSQILQTAKAKVAAIEASIASIRAKKLAALPSEHGFETTATFISALRQASADKEGGQKRRKTTRTAPTTARKQVSRTKRASAKPAVRKSAGKKKPVAQKKAAGKK